MKTQFLSELYSSFYLWLENRLVSDKVKAYTSGNSNSFEYESGFTDIPSTYVAYQGKFRQLVADHNVDIPNSGVFVNGTFTSGDSPDIEIDYYNGRVIFPEASGTALTVSANSTVKEINVYQTEDDEETILMKSDFVDASDPNNTHFFSKTDKRDETTYLLPACFVLTNDTKNTPFAFGGEDITTTRIRVIVVARENYVLQSIISSLSDSERECITRIPFGDFPYGRWWSVKSYPYEYSNFISSYTPKTYISQVMSSRITSSDILSRIGGNLLVGYVDFDLHSFRYPRI